MRPHISRRLARSVLRLAYTFGICVGLATTACECRAAAVDCDSDPPPQLPAQATEIRSGGVLAESYAYHRRPLAPAESAPRSVVPASGWYGYGFPVSTFRWGWFGAAHYYPTTFWHDGYYGTCCRYGYRRGY